MKFSLIICTYKRALSLRRLLDSVARQVVYPDEILIVDGSPDDETEAMLKRSAYENLVYYSVPPQERGLTRQRNFGIDRLSADSEIVCFLDDDIVLTETYFQKLTETYTQYPDALGVGGYILNESACDEVGRDYKPRLTEYVYDGWRRSDGSRFVIRKVLGLDSDRPPGFPPSFAHGRSVGFLPPSGKIYETGTLMGGVSSFRKEVFDTFRFSSYFEGYGLYEDADFTIRVAKKGKLYCNTNACLMHYHHSSGRPNHYRYGRMVVRNGWYVWRVAHASPSFKARAKWNLITLLLAAIRLSNTFTTKDRGAALSESTGRFVAWVGLIFSKPHIDEDP